MVNFCAVIRCSNKAGKNYYGSFFRIPAINPRAGNFLQDQQRNRREKWINALRRADITEDKIKNLRICSDHFILGRPADPEDVNNPDWVPSVKMGYKRSHPESENDCRRFKRFKKKVLADLENVMPEGESEYEQCDSYIAEDTETKKGIATETTFENIIKWEEGYKKVPVLEEKISCLERENQSLRKELSARNEEIFKLQDRVHALILIEQSMRKTRKR